MYTVFNIGIIAALFACALATYTHYKVRCLADCYGLITFWCTVKSEVENQPTVGDVNRAPSYIPLIDKLRGRPGRDGMPGRNGLPGEQGQRGPTGTQGLPEPVSAGVTYIRWGRITCPEALGTELVYSGRAAGTHYTQKGGSAEKTCLYLTIRTIFQVQTECKDTACYMELSMKCMHHNHSPIFMTTVSLVQSATCPLEQPWSWFQPRLNAPPCALSSMQGIWWPNIYATLVQCSPVSTKMVRAFLAELVTKMELCSTWGNLQRHSLSSLWHTARADMCSLHQVKQWCTYMTIEQLHYMYYVG